MLGLSAKPLRNLEFFSNYSKLNIKSQSVQRGAERHPIHWDCRSMCVEQSAGQCGPSVTFVDAGDDRLQGATKLRYARLPWRI